MLGEAVSEAGRGTGNSSMHVDDSSLVEAAKRGDGAAFETLYKRHERAILSRALRITGNHEDSEDVVQLSFEKAFIHLNTFEGRSSFSTWLTRIALNEALMLRRKWRKAREVSIDERPDTEEDSVIGEIPDSRPNPERRYFEQECCDLMLMAIDELRPGMRAALQIFDLNERSLNETAQILGLTTVAVKSRLNRARKIVREKLNRDFDPRRVSLRSVPVVSEDKRRRPN